VLGFGAAAVLGGPPLESFDNVLRNAANEELRHVSSSCYRLLAHDVEAQTGEGPDCPAAARPKGRAHPVARRDCAVNPVCDDLGGLAS
jgi:hypothetical protein